MVKILEGISLLCEKDDSVLEIISNDFSKKLKTEVIKNITACNLNFAAKILPAISMLPYDETFDRSIYKSL